MNKKILILIVAVIAIISIVAVIVINKNNNKDIDMMSLINQKNNKVTYVDFSYESISFKLPEEWNVKKVENRLEGNFENKNTAFSVMSQDVPSSQFGYFSKTFMPEMISNLPYTTFESSSSKNFSSYYGYDYNAKTIINGQSVPTRATAISVNDKVIVFLLVTGDNNFNYEEIYDNILLSIE